MHDVNLDDLMRTLELTGDVADIDFADLGFDPAGVRALGARLQRRYCVPVSGEDMRTTGTPRGALALVNRLLLDVAG